MNIASGSGISGCTYFHCRFSKGFKVRPDLVSLTNQGNFDGFSNFPFRNLGVGASLGPIIPEMAEAEIPI